MSPGRLVALLCLAAFTWLVLIGFVLGVLRMVGLPG